MIDRFEKLSYEGLAVRRVDERGYITFKYKNKVFYDNLWYISPDLLECRGIVFDTQGRIVQRPFKKIFNIGENNTLLPDGTFLAVEKINGFMAAASWSPAGDFIVSTTGTTTSDYANLARERLLPLANSLHEEQTYIFEIVDQSDPHIVPEVPGEYLLGVRNKETGFCVQVEHIHQIADRLGVFSPKVFRSTADNFHTALQNSKKEGYVVWDSSGTEMVVKAKSPHYLSKKALMRLGKGNIKKMFNQPEKFKTRIDEEFYEVYDWLLTNQTEESYLDLGEQGRRKLIERYFYG